MKDKCPQCARVFDDKYGLLVTDAYLDGVYVRMCPLCYAEDHIRRHGCVWKPTGEIASFMFNQAKEQYPQWEKQYQVYGKRKYRRKQVIHL